MEQAAEILVIILSVVLSIFLIVGIVFVIALIKLTKTIKHIVDKADQVIDNVESAAETFKNVAGPLASGKVIMNIIDLVSRKGKKG